MIVKRIKSLMPLVLDRRYTSVVDFGAGTFRNTRFLMENGLKVIAVEKPEVIKKFLHPDRAKGSLLISAVSDVAFPLPDIKADIIICTFVLNLLDWETNKKIAGDFSASVRSGGIVLVEVKEKTVPAKQCAMTLTELDRIFLANSFCRLEWYRGRSSIGALYERL